MWWLLLRFFFHTSHQLLKEVNATIITIVPKKPNPMKMGDFRPISCCNLIYKCITKILANRLVSCLDAIISPIQTAFVPSRSIAENVLLAQEVVRDYHKVEGKARFTLKIDLMKAYDSVSWDFPLHCLRCFGFPVNFVGWIRECITSSKFSVALNGRRGLDPLSPYLFVVAMEILARLLRIVLGSKLVSAFILGVLRLILPTFVLQMTSSSFLKLR